MQPICNSIAIQHISMSECYQISCIIYNIECNLSYVKSCTYATLATQLQLWRNNYYVTLMQLVCNYYGNVMLTSFFINPSKSNTWHYGGFWMNFFFLILMSTIHYDCSFIVVLDCDTWHSQKLPSGILIEFWKVK